MTERDELPLLTGAYALHTLSDSERVELEVLLAESEELRTEVTGLTETAVLLGLSATPVTPTPELKAGIMAMLATTPQLGPLEEQLPAEQIAREADAATDDSHTQAAISSIATASHHSHRATTKANARWFRRPAGVMLAAAAAVALVVGGVGGALIGINQPGQLDQLLASSDRQISASAVDGGGRATLIWSEDLGSSAVLLDGLPTLPDGQVYQFWYLDGSDAASAGLLDDADAGVKTLASDPGAGVSVAISVEPAGGSDSPTTTPIVVIDQA